MSLKQQIDADLKAAMLGGDKEKTSTLRGLKSALLNVEIAANKREQGLSDDEVVAVLQKEAKKRQESADLYKQGGSQDKAEAELAEKTVVETYLPTQASEEEVAKVVDRVVFDTGAMGMQAMGQVIGMVKSELGAGADGAMIARIVKEKLA